VLNFTVEWLPGLTYTFSEIDTVVSRGTVYRAIDKSNGPARQIIANFGLLQLEEYNSKCAPHRDAMLRFNNHDRRRYVDDCVNWIIKKVYHSAYFVLL
jgi:hypothetical protein